jgi:NAD(P)H-hydrate epimerase
MVAACHLSEAGANVSLYFAKMPAGGEEDPNMKRVREKSLFVADAENDQRWRVLKNLLGGVTVLIDAVFGTGVRLPLKGKAADLLKQVAATLDEREAPPPLCVAVDCPSGTNCDTGECDAAVLSADVTVTMIAAKRGQLVFPAAEKAGELIVADCGVRDDLPELAAVKLELATPASVRALLPRRPRDAHKGTFGRALVVAGSINFTGAAYLSGAGAYRVGAGLVTLAVPGPIYTALAAQLPEATWLMLPHDTGVIASGAADMLLKELSRYDALLVGPGLGTEKETGQCLRRLLRLEDLAHKGAMGFAPRTAPESAAPSSAALPPLVVDADGLRLLAQIEGWSKALPREAVLTPHPGEMAALTGQDKEALQADRVGTAQKYAAEWGHVVVLKGAFTVVAAPDGGTTVVPIATAALARAGTGDVLAGAIVGFMAQGLQPYSAAVAGAFVHGMAGQLAAEMLGTTASVLASDVLEALPLALEAIGSD